MNLGLIVFRCRVLVAHLLREDKNQTIQASLASNHIASFRGMLPHLGHPVQNGHQVVLVGLDNRGPTDQTAPWHQYQHLSEHSLLERPCVGLHSNHAYLVSNIHCLDSCLIHAQGSIVQTNNLLQLLSRTCMQQHQFQDR